MSKPLSVRAGYSKLPFWMFLWPPVELFSETDQGEDELCPAAFCHSDGLAGVLRWYIIRKKIIKVKEY